MKKVLITGGAGFIGYHLAKNLLNYNYQIDIVDNFSRAVKDKDLLDLAKNKNVKLINLDLLNLDSLKSLNKKYNLIFHLAAIIGVQHVLKEPYNVLAKNVDLVKNVIIFSKKNKKLERLVFFSTSEVYAGTLKYFNLTIPTKEDTPLTLTELTEPRTSYMLSKIYGEALCLHSGLPVTIVRPHNFYGPRMGLSHVIPELFKKVYFSQNNKLEVFSTNHTRTFCYIDDAVEMIRLLAESREGMGNTYNIGNESPEISIKFLANEIIKIVGQNVKIVPKPATSGSPARRCPKMRKTFNVTGYVSKFNLHEGLVKTYEWYVKNVFTNKGISAI